jgi:hypothetical protein
MTARTFIVGLNASTARYFVLALPPTRSSTARPVARTGRTRSISMRPAALILWPPTVAVSVTR